MQNLLIVDDEPNIVEGLAHQFEALGLDALMVMKAFSGNQALSILQGNKVDIVLSDISMPGMDGLELMERTSRFWPHIRFVFLTGYSDFDYIHRASKSPIYAGYLLKTEDGKVIIEKIIDELKKRKEAVCAETNIALLKDRIGKLDPLLHRIYLESVLKGPDTVPMGADDIIWALDLHIDPSRPVLLVLGKILKAFNPLRDMRDMMIADQLLAQEAGGLLDHECVLCEENIVWFLQPTGHGGSFGDDSQDAALAAYVRAVIQSIQQQFNDYYGVPVTYVISSHRVPFQEVHVQHELIRTILSMLKLDGQSLIIVDQSLSYDMIVSGEKICVLDKISFSNKIHRLESLLEAGAVEELRAGFREMFDLGAKPLKAPKAEEALLLVMLLLSVAKRHNLADWLSENPFFQNPFIHGCHTKPEIFYENYLETCCRICEMRVNLEILGRQRIVDRINQYIDENIRDYGLSLAKIANISCFNPAYLSRFYKQQTGKNLSDHINQKRLELAKSLLAGGMMIRDVAEKTGYASPSSFILFFKRNLGITPRQYQSECNFN